MWKMFCLFPAGDSVSTVRLRRTLHLHVAHTWRTSDLPSLQLLQVLAVCRRHAGEETLRHTNESFSSLFLSVLLRDVHNRGLWCVAARSPGHPGGRTRQQLRWDRCQGQTDGAAAESPTAGGAGGPDPEGAELPAGQSETPWRFFVFVRNTWRPWTSELLVSQALWYYVHAQKNQFNRTFSPLYLLSAPVSWQHEACTLHQTSFIKSDVLPPDVLLFLPQLVIKFIMT